MTTPTPPRSGTRDAPPGADTAVPISRTGLLLFWMYVLLYGGFMGLVLVRPDLLALRPFGGVNLAILAGLGLIAAAFVLALISMLEPAAR
jgi:uncharacterized membrane protein (DUF485 family)